MTRHVVFGAGQVGRLVAEQLTHRGVDVVAVNRDGQGHLPGARVVGGDASDPAFTTRAAMTAELLDAHRAGRHEVVIGRASDYFGPGAIRSALRLVGVAKP
jgi:nucleoside-diphosphate-sugar epimerase